MEKLESIEKGIQQGDIEGLREAIGTICYVRRDFSGGEFDEAIKYVESKGIKIKDDALIGDLVSTNKSAYTDEDFTRAVFELKGNFCDERIEDVKKIGKSLYGKKKSQVKSEAGTPGADPNAHSHQESKRNLIKIGLLVAAVIIIILVYLLVK